MNAKNRPLRGLKAGITGSVILLVVLLLTCGCTQAPTAPPTTAAPTATSPAPTTVAATPATTSAPAMAVYTGSDSGKTVNIPKNAEFSIELEENPSTGYAWNATVTSGLEILSSEFRAGGTMPGAGGMRVWILKASGAGHQEFTALYSRSWENLTGNETAYSLSVEVTQGAGMKVYTEGDNGKTVNIPKNTEFSVRLEENPTTGFQWNATVTSGLEILSSDYTENPHAAGMVGVGGIHTWTIRASGTGLQKFDAVYRRGWEPLTGNETAYSLSVQIA